MLQKVQLLHTNLMSVITLQKYDAVHSDICF